MLTHITYFVLGVILGGILVILRAQSKIEYFEDAAAALEQMNEKLKELLLKAKEGIGKGGKEMRANPFYCECGYKLWEDEGEFYKIKDDGTWSGELTHCPKCQKEIKGQEGTEEGFKRQCSKKQ